MAYRGFDATISVAESLIKMKQRRCKLAVADKLSCPDRDTSRLFSLASEHANGSRALMPSRIKEVDFATQSATAAQSVLRQKKRYLSNETIVARISLRHLAHKCEPFIGRRTNVQ
jgi:hypothetical protein